MSRFPIFKKLKEIRRIVKFQKRRFPNKPRNICNQSKSVPAAGRGGVREVL
jgi:hypothetical protein